MDDWDSGPSSGGFTDLVSRIRECSNLFLEVALKKRGLTGLVPAHGQVLFPLLMTDDSLTLGEIARKSGRAKSTITGMADTLVKYGYIKRISCEQDKRSVRVALTDKGRGIREIFKEISEELNKTVFKDIPTADQQEVMKILLKIERNLTLSKNI